MRQEVDAFLDYLGREKGFSQNTIEAYQNDLDQLVRFLEEYGKKRGFPSHWSGIDKEPLTAYTIDLKQREYAPSTIARKVSAMKSLFRFLATKGIVKRVPETAPNPSHQMRRGSPQSLSVEEVQTLLRQTERSSGPDAARDKAMLELLYATGMRVSEVVALNLEDADIEGACIYVIGRNSQARMLLLPRETLNSLRNYIQNARPKMAQNHDEQALFLNRLGQRLTRQGLWQILRSHAEAANLGAKVTPRALRHPDLHSGPSHEALGNSNGIEAGRAWSSLA
jgi:integrase/recombinase XerD